MITQETRTEIERGGDFVEKEMTIKATGKAFKILAASIYSDKSRAVLAECGQNCADSHIRAGKENIPFEITLPSQFSPELIFRDFGVSMDMDFMLNRYSVLFDSTKDSTNTMSGCWGLGKLSPMCLTDSYTVTCFDGNEKIIYNVYYNEQTKPSVAVFLKEKSNEPKGVEVRVAVPRQYINEFRGKVIEVFKFYPTKPIIKNSNIVIPSLDYIIQSPDKTWGFTKNSNSSPIAIMGCYSYPIKFSAIPNLTTEQANILGCNSLVINFNIGELDVTASREGLSYDPTTCANLIKKVNQVLAEVKDTCKDLLKNCKNLQEAYELYGELFNYNGRFYALRYVLQGIALEWNGIKINSSEIYSSKWNADGISVLQVKSPRYRRSENLRFLSCGLINFNKGDYYCNYSSKTRKGIILIENDCPRPIRLKDRIKKYWDTTEVGSIYIFSFADAAARQKAIDNFNYDKFDVVKLSTLPFDATAKAYVKNLKHGQKVFKFNEDVDSRKKSDYWDVTSVDFNKDTGVYVEIEGFEHKNKNGWLDAPKNLIYLITKIQNAGITPPTIYGIKTKSLDKIKNNKNWQNFWDYIKEKTQNTIDSLKLGDLLAEQNDFLSLNRYDNLGKLAENYSQFNGDISQFLTKIHDISKNLQKHENLVNLAASLGIEVTQNKTKTISSTWKDLQKKYPLLDIIIDKVSGYQYSSIVGELVKYEKMVNRDLKTQP